MTRTSQQQQQANPVRSWSQDQGAVQTQSAISPAPVTMKSPSHEDIAVRAYGIYSIRDRANGQCQQNWHQAEHELRKQQAASGTHECQNSPMAHRDGTHPAGKNYDEVMPSGTIGNIANSGRAARASATAPKNKH